MDTVLRVSIDLPPGWHTRLHPEAGIVAQARAAQGSRAGAAPEMVLRTTTTDDDLTTWRRSALDALGAQLTAFEVDDEDDYELDGRHVLYHRFAHRLGSEELISEQWSWLVDGLGATLTCTVAREDYATWCELFEDVAATVEILSGE